MSKLSDNYSPAKKSSDSFRTPPELFNALNEVTPFFWDACCTKDNCLLPTQVPLITDFGDYNYLTYQFQNHQKDIYKDMSIFINPPYSRGSVGPIIEKAWEDSRHFRVVMLLKADMSTNWFNENIIDKSRQWPKHVHQALGTPLSATYQVLLNYMKDDNLDVGILHLRKRVKFLADEEMMLEDAKKYPDDASGFGPIDTIDTTFDGWELMTTKNFTRGADNLIYPKSGPTFPSMLVVLDRRDANGSKSL